MGENVIWFVLGVAVFVVGFVLFMRSLKKTSQNAAADTIAYKDGVPILPRNQRLPNNESEDGNESKMQPPSQTSDALDQLATVAATRTQKTEAVSTSNSTQDLESMALAQSSGDAVTTDMTSHNAPNFDAQQNHTQEPTAAFDEQMPALDDYLYQQHNDNLRDNQALFTYEQTMTVVLSPRNKFAGIDGQVIMNLARQYALKYGVLNAFHRYENPEGTGVLWFSMLGVGNQGVEAFDLLALPEMNYRGLSFFVPLPHPQALRGFDSMIQVAMSMADELDADICDEAGCLLDANQIQAMRAMVSDYRST